jgi:hypothetical protein
LRSGHFLSSGEESALPALELGRFLHGFKKNSPATMRITPRYFHGSSKRSPKNTMAARDSNSARMKSVVKKREIAKLRWMRRSG